MTSFTAQKRVLALDLRPRSFGYAVLEGPNQLLDWGVRSFRKGVNAVRVPPSEKLAALLEEYAPSMVVLKERRLPADKRSGNPRKILGAIQKEAKRRRVRVRLLRRRAVQHAFGAQDRFTKHDIASMVAARFPELAAKLPPKRKPWQSEDYRMSIFDATALGVASFGRPAAPSSSPGGLAPP